LTRVLSALMAMMLIAGCGASAGALEGHSADGEYRGPDDLFRVDVPRMRNPFIKEPSEIRDRRRPDGGAEVTFSVAELGEAWRFGVRSFALGADSMAAVCDEELERWQPAPGAPEILLEEEFQHDAGPALTRIYHVESASLLFVRQGEGPAGRASALIGVVVVQTAQAGPVLYAVGQFDMPNRGGHYTLETERGRQKLAAQQLKRLRELSASLRLQ